MPGWPSSICGDRVAHRLHEAVDQRGRQCGAGGRVDAPGGDEAVALGLQEARLPGRPRRGWFSLGQRAGDAAAHVVDLALVALGVLLEQHLEADGLRGQGGAGGPATGSAGSSSSLQTEACTTPSRRAIRGGFTRRPRAKVRNDARGAPPAAPAARGRRGFAGVASAPRGISKPVLPCAPPYKTIRCRPWLLVPSHRCR